MAYVMRSAGLAFCPAGQPDHSIGLLLKSYDPEAHGGRGEIVWTVDPGAAKRFPGFLEVLQEWKRSPECHPVRATDGKPNRPLTAYSIEPVQVPD